MTVLTACTPPLSKLKQDIPQTGSLTGTPETLAFDPMGQLEAAKRLCHPLLSLDQKRLGLSLATAAATHFQEPSDEAQIRTSNLEAARCAALLLDEETDGDARGLLLEAGMNAAKRAGSSEVLTGFCVPPSGKNHGENQSDASHEPPLPICDETTLEAAYLHALLAGQRMQVAGMKEALQLLSDEMILLDVAITAPHLDQGGPLRIYGLLLLKAPAWPAGPGDLDKALDLLNRAADAFPSHPLNHLFLALALNEDGDTAAAKDHLEKGLSLAREEIWGAALVAKWRDVDALTSVPK